jgi:hypothetical protein
LKESLERLRALSRAQSTDRVLVDLGTFGQSALLLGSTAGAELARQGHPRCVVDPHRRHLCLGPAAAQALGSDFVRLGWHRTEAGAGKSRAVPSALLSRRWFAGAGSRLSATEVLGLTLPPGLPHMLTHGSADSDEHLEMLHQLDPPIDGPLTTLAALMGAEAHAVLMAGPGRPRAGLFDWAFDTCARAYARVLESLPQRPQIVWMRDDFGLAPPQVIDNEILPRWRRWLSRGWGSTLPAMQCDAAAWARLAALADAGVRIVSPGPDCAPAPPGRLRQGLPDTLILHGVTDFDALLEALRGGRAQGLIDAACDLALCWPVIASPCAPLPMRTPLADLSWASNYLKTLALGNRKARREIIADRPG